MYHFQIVREATLTNNVIVTDNKKNMSLIFFQQNGILKRRRQRESVLDKITFSLSGLNGIHLPFRFKSSEFAR